VERFNRTLTDEWAYARIYTSNHERTAVLANWLHTISVFSFSVGARAGTTVRFDPPRARRSQRDLRHRRFGGRPGHTLRVVARAVTMAVTLQSSAPGNHQPLSRSSPRSRHYPWKHEDSAPNEPGEVGLNPLQQRPDRKAPDDDH